MRVGNAPVSWGIFEVEGLSAQIPYQQVMDEICRAGYEGSELGPWGYYPTEPDALRRDLAARHLALASAFVPVDLTDPAGFARATADVLRTADVLQALGTSEVILADPQRPNRTLRAGWATAADEMPAAAWEATIRGLNQIGARLAERGMRAVYHHHVATFVETPAEIDRLLERTDPDLVGLCLDTGHAAFGGADPVALLRRWGGRVGYVHLKDVNPRVLERVRAEKLDLDAALREGIFCPLGEGCVDFPAVFALLRENHYDGWLIVEQDVIIDEKSGAPSPSPLEAARQSREFVRKTLGE
jgi:inosose dehydratase